MFVHVSYVLGWRGFNAILTRDERFFIESSSNLAAAQFAKLFPDTERRIERVEQFTISVGLC